MDGRLSGSRRDKISVSVCTGFPSDSGKVWTVQISAMKGQRSSLQSSPFMALCCPQSLLWSSFSVIGSRSKLRWAETCRSLAIHAIMGWLWPCCKWPTSVAVPLPFVPLDRLGFIRTKVWWQSIPNRNYLARSPRASSLRVLGIRRASTSRLSIIGRLGIRTEECTKWERHLGSSTWSQRSSVNGHSAKRWQNLSSSAFVSARHWRPSRDQFALLNFIMYRAVYFTLLVKCLTAIEYLNRLSCLRHANGRGRTQ